MIQKGGKVYISPISMRPSQANNLQDALVDHLSVMEFPSERSRTLAGHLSDIPTFEDKDDRKFKSLQDWRRVVENDRLLNVALTFGPVDTLKFEFDAPVNPVPPLGISPSVEIKPDGHKNKVIFSWSHPFGRMDVPTNSSDVGWDSKPLEYYDSLDRTSNADERWGNRVIEAYQTAISKLTHSIDAATKERGGQPPVIRIRKKE